MMRDHLRLTPSDDRVTAALRGLYAPPADGEYWDELEREIMARVVGAPGTTPWWSAFAGWVPLGVAAAGLAALLAGLAMRSARTVEARVAYEAIVQSSPLVPDRSPSVSPATEREATLRYLVTY
jgi:hypothetical protein